MRLNERHLSRALGAGTVSSPTVTTRERQASFDSLLGLSHFANMSSLDKPGHSSSYESLMTDSRSKSAALADMSTPSLLQEQIAAPGASKSTAPKIKWDLLYPDEPIAVTLVPQAYLPEDETVWRYRIGWIAVVNSAGQTIYDPFATYPKEDGLKKYFNSKRFNAAKEDLLFRRGARDGKEVERNLMKLLEGRIVVLHKSSQFSKDHFYFEQQEAFEESLLYDTQTLYADLHPDGTPSLYAAAREVLGQDVKRCDVARPEQDAALAMGLYLRKLPYDRVRKGMEWDSRGWSPSMTREMARLKRGQGKVRVDSVTRVKTTETVEQSAREEEKVESRERWELGDGGGGNPATLDAAKQFALRLQRRHFAEVMAQTSPIE